MAEAKFMTPRGIADWPHLNDPDTKHDADGVYKVKLKFNADDPAVQALKAKADELAEARFEEEKKALIDAGKKALAEKLSWTSPFTVEEDPETGEETGMLVANFKMKASGTSKKTGKRWTRRPDIFNGQGVKLKNAPKIGGGSTLKVGGIMRDYYIAKDKVAGVTFYMDGFQIIKLVSFGERSASDYGFGAEDDADAIENASDEFAADADADDISDDEDFS